MLLEHFNLNETVRGNCAQHDGVPAIQLGASTKLAVLLWWPWSGGSLRCLGQRRHYAVA